MKKILLIIGLLSISIPSFANYDTVSGHQIVEIQGYSVLNIAGAATTTVKSGAGVLYKIVFNKPIALGVVTIYDNTAASGTKLGTITNPAALLQQQFTQDYGCTFGTGLTVVTSAADDITVIYR